MENERINDGATTAADRVWNGVEIYRLCSHKNTVKTRQRDGERLAVDKKTRKKTG